MDDITEQMDGFLAPKTPHIVQVLDFVRGWDRTRAGGSLLCRHQPLDRERLCRRLHCSIRSANERIIAGNSRASRRGRRNRLIVKLADKAAGTDGRMLRALDEMGPGNKMMVEGRRSASISTDARETPPDERKTSDADRNRPDRGHRAIEGNEPLILTASGGRRRQTRRAFRSVRSKRSRTAPSRSACAPG